MDNVTRKLIDAFEAHIAWQNLPTDVKHAAQRAGEDWDSSDVKVQF
jgi:hypothetical protein